VCQIVVAALNFGGFWAN